MGPAGTPAQARAVERLRQKWVKDRLVERGRVHARAMGFTDIYSFTKAMAEHALVELHGDIPLSILRPSIVESALQEPFPGWLEGFRMAEPIIFGFGRGMLRMLTVPCASARAFGTATSPPTGACAAAIRRSRRHCSPAHRVSCEMSRRPAATCCSGPAARTSRT